MKKYKYYELGFEQNMQNDIIKEIKEGKLNKHKDFCQKWSEKIFNSLNNAEKWEILSKLQVELNEALDRKIEDITDFEEYHLEMDLLLKLALEEYIYQVILDFAYYNNIELD